MRKVMALVGAAVLVLASAAPAFACDCPPPPTCTEGNEITIGVAALDGHLLGGYLPAPDGVKKVTICHTGQTHDGDAFIAWAL